jgi:uncharacterized damage-inducible protein DinB
MDAELRQLLRAFDQAYDKHSWHGTNLRGAVRGITAASASRRPASGRHNIWEIVVHAAYWKYAVWRRLAGAGRGTFPLKGSNWFERPLRHAMHEAAWRADLDLLAAMHRQLRETIRTISSAKLRQRSAGSQYTNIDLVTGITAHDLYHAGQIQLIKRLAR